MKTNLTQTKQRAIGPAGTIGRIVLGVFLVLVPVWAPAWWGDGVGLADLALGLLAFPAAVLVIQWLRMQFTSHRLGATGPLGLCANLTLGVALFSFDSTRDAVALFAGASLLLAAARGYAGCEVTAISNWLLRRDDQVGCVVFSPLDKVEKKLVGS